MNKIKLFKENHSIIVFFFLLCLFCVSKSTYASTITSDNGITIEQKIKKQTVTIDIKNQSIKDILYEMQKQSGISFAFKEQNVGPELSNMTLQVKDSSIDKALETLLASTSYTYTVVDDAVVIVKRQQTPQPTQKKIIYSGKVIDGESKKPIAGVTIIVVGSTNGAITDEKGLFSLTMNTNDEIEVSFVGMKTITRKITAESKDVVIELTKDILAVDDVVVTGYFTRKKESYTGATTTFTGNDLRSISSGNLLNSLSMLDPSFTRVVNNDMGSNPNAIPDFEIRGAGSLKGEYQGNPNMPTFILDGFEVSATKVFDLDPNRVRSMTILKDAAATAIYGSRAANGVVVIETEIPTTGKLRATYNGYLNFELADLSGYDLMNSKEKLEYERLAGLYEQSGRPDWIDNDLDLYNEKLKLVEQGINTDWLAAPIRTLGVGHKHSVTLEGGDNTFRYGFDLYYSDKIGVMKESGRKNYGGGIRLQYNVGRFKFTNYTSFDHILSKNSPYGDYSLYGYANPYYYPYDKNKKIKKELYEYEYYDLGIHTKTMYNWMYNGTLPIKDQSVSNNFLNNFALEYDIITGLKLKANISLSVDDTKTDKYLPNEYIYNENASDYDKKFKDYNGSYKQQFEKKFSYDINVVLSYFKQFDKHTINIGAVYNIRETNSDGTNLFAIGFPNANMDHISMGIKHKDGDKPTGFYDTSRLIGIVGNAGYTYDNKYLLDLSVRSDGSSLYGKNNPWGTFWSVGLGWNINKENFLKDSEFVSLLKLRGSIGTTGGQNFYAYQSMAMYSYNDAAISSINYGGYIGAILKAFGNSNLKWQKIEKKNIGFDFEILDRRFSGTFNYYQNLSKDALVDVSIAPSLGFSSYKENLGEIKNSGVELTLKGSVLRDYTKNLRWDLMFNLVHNKNEIMKINDALTAFNEKQDAEVKNKPTIRYEEGRSQNTIWANESVGIDPATGEEVFIDRYGKLTNKWSPNNYKPLGCSDPTIYGTFGTLLAYKGWELSANFYYSYGGDNYNQTLLNKIENVNPNENGDRRILYDRWKKPGDVAKYKKISDISTTQPSSRFIEKNNYIQLQSVGLSYTLNGDLLRKSGIERLKISAIGNDVFTASTIKMERGINYPFARTFSVSVQLTF